MSADRCSGACCREFPLVGIGHTVEKILEYLRAGRALDGEQIADMIIPVRPIVAGTVLPTGRVMDATPPGGGWLFTCRHFDPVTADCGIYATRPRMCRNYPYGHPCEHGDACSWTSGRLGAWPLTFHRWTGFSDERGEMGAKTHLRVLQPDGRDHETALRAADAVSDCAKATA